jgi:hypothetical protein
MLVSIFGLLVASLNGGWRRLGFPFSLLTAMVIAFVLLGLLLAVLTVRLQETRIRKMFFVLTGISAAAIPVCAVLHNLVYGLFIVWFGEGFWERHGRDEPVFFLLAVVVCPVLFLVGTVGSIVFLGKDFTNRLQGTANHGSSRGVDDA